MVGMAYVTRLHSGSYVNDTIPAHIAIAVTAGLGLGRLYHVEPRAARDRMTVFGSLVALAQLVLLIDSPDRWIPTEADVSEGKFFIATMKQYPGDVFLTHHGALNHRAGKPALIHGMAIVDVLRSTAPDYRDARTALRQSIDSAFATKRFSAVFTDDDLIMPELRDRYYERVVTYAYNAQLFQTKIGAYRPRFLYTPRP
jgi:hypothetical protein